MDQENLLNKLDPPSSEPATVKNAEPEKSVPHSSISNRRISTTEKDYSVADADVPRAAVQVHQEPDRLDEIRRSNVDPIRLQKERLRVVTFDTTVGIVKKMRAGGHRWLGRFWIWLLGILVSPWIWFISIRLRMKVVRPSKLKSSVSVKETRPAPSLWYPVSRDLSTGLEDARVHKWIFCPSGRYALDVKPQSKRKDFLVLDVLNNSYGIYSNQSRDEPKFEFIAVYWLNIGVIVYVDWDEDQHIIRQIVYNVDHKEKTVKIHMIRSNDLVEFTPQTSQFNVHPLRVDGKDFITVFDIGRDKVLLLPYDPVRGTSGIECIRNLRALELEALVLERIGTEWYFNYEDSFSTGNELIILFRKADCSTTTASNLLLVVVPTLHGPFRYKLYQPPGGIKEVDLARFYNAGKSFATWSKPSSISLRSTAVLHMRIHGNRAMLSHCRMRRNSFVSLDPLGYLQVWDQPATLDLRCQKTKVRLPCIARVVPSLQQLCREKVIQHLRDLQNPGDYEQFLYPLVP